MDLAGEFDFMFQFELDRLQSQAGDGVWLQG